MNTTNHPTPDDLTLLDLARRFPDEESALAYFETMRWPDGVTCVHCGNADKAKLYKRTHNAKASVRAGLWECGACGAQFTANTMATVSEAIGLALPYSAGAPAPYEIRDRFCMAAGELNFGPLRPPLAAIGMTLSIIGTIAGTLPPPFCLA